MEGRTTLEGVGTVPGAYPNLGRMTGEEVLAMVLIEEQMGNQRTKMKVRVQA